VKNEEERRKFEAKQTSNQEVTNKIVKSDTRVIPAGHRRSAADGRQVDGFSFTTLWLFSVLEDPLGVFERFWTHFAPYNMGNQKNNSSEQDYTVL
jgi:hypothetical protein